MSFDVRNLTSREVKVKRLAHKFIKDGEVVIDRERGTLDKLVERIEDTVWINSDDDKFINEIKEIYAGEVSDFRIGLSPARREEV